MVKIGKENEKNSQHHREDGEKIHNVDDESTTILFVKKKITTKTKTRQNNHRNKQCRLELAKN